MKYIVYAMAAMFFLASCSKDNDETGGGNGGGGETGGVTDVTPVTSDLTVNLTTDKACYKPGLPLQRISPDIWQMSIALKKTVRKSFSVLLPSMYPATGHASRVMALSPPSTLLKRKVKFKRKWLF